VSVKRTSKNQVIKVIAGVAMAGLMVPAWTKQPDYSYEITPNIRQKLIDLSKQKIPDVDDVTLDELLRTVVPAITFKNMMAVERLVSPCSSEIHRYCGTLDNGHELIECLKLNRVHVSDGCEAKMATVFGGKPFSEPTLFS